MGGVQPELGGPTQDRRGLIGGRFMRKQGEKNYRKVMIIFHVTCVTYFTRVTVSWRISLELYRERWNIFSIQNNFIQF